MVSEIDSQIRNLADSLRNFAKKLEPSLRHEVGDMLGLLAKMVALHNSLKLRVKAREKKSSSETPYGVVETKEVDKSGSEDEGSA